MGQLICCAILACNLLLTALRGTETHALPSSLIILFNITLQYSTAISSEKRYRQPFSEKVQLLKTLTAFPMTTV